MGTVTISPKFRIMIPKEVREILGLFPGQKLQAIAHSDRIELVPVRPMKKLRGFLKGLDTSVDRVTDRM